jgi:hypothetical protein
MAVSSGGRGRSAKLLDSQAARDVTDVSTNKRRPEDELCFFAKTQVTGWSMRRM